MTLNFSTKHDKKEYQYGEIIIYEPYAWKQITLLIYKIFPKTNVSPFTLVNSLNDVYNLMNHGRSYQ